MVLVSFVFNHQTIDDKTHLRLLFRRTLWMDLPAFTIFVLMHLPAMMRHVDLQIEILGKFHRMTRSHFAAIEKHLDCRYPTSTNVKGTTQWGIVVGVGLSCSNGFLL
jgi:hypothetical protein